MLVQGNSWRFPIIIHIFPRSLRIETWIFYHRDLRSFQGLGEMARGDVRENAAPSFADHLPNQWSLDPEIASKAIAWRHGGK